MKDEIKEIVAKLFENGNTPLTTYGFDPELFFRVEQENPHVAKQYPITLTEEQVLIGQLNKFTTDYGSSMLIPKVIKPNTIKPINLGNTHFTAKD